MKFEEIKEYIKKKAPKYVYYDTMGPICIEFLIGWSYQ